MADEDNEQVVVPNLVGLPVHEARGLANDSNLVLTSGAPDGPPLASLTWSGYWVVTAQRPGPGEVVPTGSWVVIEFIDLGGGEAGDREPRFPYPPVDRLAHERSAQRYGSD